MAKLAIEAKSAGTFTWSIHADDKKPMSVSIGADGKGARTVAEPGLYLLVWTVRGNKGTTYSYKVTLDDAELEKAPDKAKISAEKWEGGFVPFTVKP